MAFRNFPGKAPPWRFLRRSSWHRLTLSRCSGAQLLPVTCVTWGSVTPPVTLWRTPAFTCHSWRRPVHELHSRRCLTLPGQLHCLWTPLQHSWAHMPHKTAAGLAVGKQLPPPRDGCRWRRCCWRFCALRTLATLLPISGRILGKMPYTRILPEYTKPQRVLIHSRIRGGVQASTRAIVSTIQLAPEEGLVSAGAPVALVTMDAITQVFTQVASPATSISIAPMASTTAARVTAA